MLTSLYTDLKKKELQECSLAERIIGVKADEKRIRNVEHLAVRRKTLCIRFVLIAYVFHTLDLPIKHPYIVVSFA